LSLQGKIPTLIATDVAARGIHIKRLQYVVNYDFPGNLEQYCHRIGRTGRDIKGSAFSLLTRNMHRIAPSLVTLLEATEQPIHPHLRQLALDSQQENESQEKQGFASGSEIEE
jgi:ATP-dependent RNA helicase DDX5/DBP2